MTFWPPVEIRCRPLRDFSESFGRCVLGSPLALSEFVYEKIYLSRDGARAAFVHHIDRRESSLEEIRLEKEDGYPAHGDGAYAHGGLCTKTQIVPPDIVV
jgi:hypothetical protein